MTLPTRIQRSRRKGWRNPPETIYCGRGSLWGNPFPVENGDHAEAVAKYREWLNAHPGVEYVMRLHLADAAHLSCWCALDKPCHVDVIIEVLADQWPPKPQAGDNQ
jgi:hypothetical protein